jgi:hypothetical protein
VQTAQRRTTAPPAFVAFAVPVASRGTSKIEIHVGALLVCIREERMKRRSSLPLVA